MSEENKKEKRKGFKEFDPNKYVNTKPTLDEAAKGKTAVITFGRMNPITVGHEKLVNSLIRNAASRKGAVPMVYLSHSSDPKKNPLSYEDKVKFAKKAFGNVIQKSKARTIIEALKELNGKYENVIVVVGSDRYDEFQRLLTRYNGIDYNFQDIEIVSAGARDPDAEGVEGMSASKMREYAAAEDIKNFKKGLPKKLQRDAEDVMKSVRDGMNLAEALEEIDNALVEVLDREARRKRSIAMRRVKHKLARGRAKAMKKKATTDVLKQRAQKAAVKALKDKFAKNKRYADMDLSQKMVVDKKIAKISKSRIERIAKKLLPKVKQKERDKFKAKASDDPSTTKQESYIFNEKMKVPQDKDIDDMPGSQPSGYYKGVDKDKKDDRARHFARKAKMDDDNPKAYAPAPGDKDAKTKPSTFTNKYKKMYGENNDWVCGQCNSEPCVCEGDIHEMWGKKVTKKPHMLMDRNNKVKFDKRFKMYAKKDDPNDPTDVLMDDEKMEESVIREIENLTDILDLMEATESYVELEEKQIEGLKKKADKTGMPYGILKKVYDRGMAAWRTGHRPGTTPQQWAMARVNSFVTKSPGTWGKADSDLAAKVRGSSKKEEVEQLDELSPRTKASYLAKAKTQNKKVQKAYDKSVKSSPDAFFGDDSPEDQKRMKTMTKRQKGIAMAKGRKYGQKYEEAGAGDAGMPADTEYEKKRRKAIKNVDTAPEIKEQRKNFKSFIEGAGEEGTDKLVKKYKKDTPNV